MSNDEPSLVDKVLAVHRAFARARITHAFGGALALAYWTADPRATLDIDVNVTLPSAQAGQALRAMPAGVAAPSDALGRIQDTDQVRLRWGRTPIDLFFRVTDFHDGIAGRSETRPFAGEPLPFVCADDLAVLKALFDRPKDWLDIAAMMRTGSLDLGVVIERVSSIVGGDDARIGQLETLLHAEGGFS